MTKNVMYKRKNYIQKVYENSIILYFYVALRLEVLVSILAQHKISDK